MIRRIRTGRHPLIRAASRLWHAADQHPLIMLTLAGIALALVNVIEQAGP